MKRVRLDGGNFENVDLRGCELVYGGGEPPVLAGANVLGSTVMFDDAAARTITVLALFSVMNPKLIQGLMDEAKQKFKYSPPGKPVN